MTPPPLQIRGKAMGGKAADLLDLMRDVLLTARLDDKARFGQMVAETKAGMESGEGPEGGGCGGGWWKGGRGEGQPTTDIVVAELGPFCV